MPSSIKEEWETNPFLRVNEESVRLYTGKTGIRVI